MSECCGVNAQDKEQRTLLWTVLGLNGGMFFVEFIAGWIGQSSGLMADSLDMLADAMVYMVGLYAVGKAIEYKAKAALFNGSLQLVLAGFILFDVIRRLISGSAPQSNIMLWISLLALAVNLFCFVLLSRYRTGDINMRASWICSRNDMIANVGVIVSAGLVVWRSLKLAIARRHLLRWETRKRGQTKRKVSLNPPVVTRTAELPAVMSSNKKATKSSSLSFGFRVKP